MSAHSRASTVASLNKSSTVCPIEVEGMSTKGFVDTGAGISLISEKFRLSSKVICKLNLENVNLKPSSVSNDPIELLGLVKLEKSWENQKLFGHFMLLAKCLILC